MYFPDNGLMIDIKTGDTSHLEIYATIAMIAGLAYLLLYYADKKGITEDQKQEMVMRMIRWARREKRLRKYVVPIPIFMLLFYYHSIGKRVCVEFDEQAT